MNIPNFLTVLRIILTFFFIYLIALPDMTSKLSAFVIFAVASITDFLDGYWARKYQLITTFGKIADPIADKFLVLSCFYVFVQNALIPFWMFGVIAVREIFVTLHRLVIMRKGKVVAAGQSGKLKTVLQMMTVYSILLFMLVGLKNAHFAGQMFWQGCNIVLMWCVVALTLYSGYEYVKGNVL